jgi:hypothetical protein
MASCATQRWSNVSQAAFNCLVQKAAQQGLPISGNSGTTVHSGFTIAWLFDPNAQILEITCTNSPGWAPCGLINAKIHDVVEQTGCI